MAQHLCASEQWGPPKTNADAFVLLSRHGAIESDLAERLAGAVGFRNVLVHEYAVVDDDRVVAALGELDDLRDFVRAIAALLADQA